MKTAAALLLVAIIIPAINAIASDFHGKILDSDGEPRGGRQEATCEGGTITLHCPAGSKIRIYAAFYGRHGGSGYCTKKRTKHGWVFTNGWKNDCPSKKSTLDKVMKKCDGKNYCQIKAENGFFGDPCKGTFKYLTINSLCFANGKEACGDTGEYVNYLDCCTPEAPCGWGQGDCDTDADCAGDLLCGEDNCQEVYGSHRFSNAKTDCCMKPKAPPNPWG